MGNVFASKVPDFAENLLSDNDLRRSCSPLHPEGAPDQKRESHRFGPWVENVCLAFAVNQNQQVTYWREEPIEVNGIFESSQGRWPVEIKTAHFTGSDLRGLFEFCRHFPEFRSLALTAPGDEDAAKKHGVSSLSWVDFFVAGLPEMYASQGEPRA